MRNKKSVWKPVGFVQDGEPCAYLSRGSSRCLGDGMEFDSKTWAVQEPTESKERDHQASWSPMSPTPSEFSETDPSMLPLFLI